MSHGITTKDSMFTVRKPAWHGLGVVLRRRPRSVQDALKKAGLAWKVVQLPVHVNRPQALTPKGEKAGLVSLDGYRANVRKDTGDVLGIVTDSYELVQNVEAFQFLSGLIGSDLHFETAGSLHAGKAVWVLAQVPDHIEVGGDKVGQYVLVTTRHDGTAAVQAKVTPVRVVCANTLGAALANRQDTYRVRHLGDPTTQLHEARAVLQLTVDFYKQFAKAGNRMATQKFSERQLAKVTRELYPDEGLSQRGVKGRQAQREHIRQLFMGEGDGARTVGNAPGTRWGAYNAIVEHVDWYGGRASARQGTEQQFIRSTEDTTGLKAQALELVRA